MLCGFCAQRFAEDRGQPACRGCPLGASCGRVRCPNCGYENPVEPKWVSTLRGRLRRFLGGAAPLRIGGDTP